MKETDLQKLVCDVISDRGGFARKLSNRFLVGVADLLIKLPEFPANVLEVKQTRWGPKLDKIELAVTKLQQEYLIDARSAGMNSGVISFVQREGRRHLWMQVFSIDYLIQTGFNVNLHQHEELGNHRVRDDNVLRILREYHERAG